MFDVNQEAAPDLQANPLEWPAFSRIELQESLSPEAYCRSRKNQSLILRNLANVGQSTVAAKLGVHESRVCRWKDDGTVEKMASMLAVLGLKVVPVEAEVFLKFED